MLRVPLFAACLAALALTVPAIAADPDKGEVSKASVKATWKGSTTNGGATTITAIMNDGTFVCQAPSCDTYTLNVKDSDKLTITATAGHGFTMVEVVMPDGSTVYNGGEETENSTQVQFENAPVGEYEIHIALNSIVTEDAYTGMAVLGPVDSKGRPLAATPPAAEPPASQTQGPAVTPAPTVTIKTRSVSARKAAKKLKVGLTTSAPVTDVRVFLKKGSKTLGKGKLARLEKSGTVSVRLARKLRKGKYTLGMTGKDSAGRVVAASAPLKVSR